LSADGIGTVGNLSVMPDGTEKAVGKVKAVLVSNKEYDRNTAKAAGDTPLILRLLLLLACRLLLLFNEVTVAALLIGYPAARKERSNGDSITAPNDELTTTIASSAGKQFRFGTDASFSIMTS
jgi:hypothetical protein